MTPRPTVRCAAVAPRGSRGLRPALAATALCLLAACGGSSDSSTPAPADTTAPAVVIGDDVTAAVASGNVTFSFTFTEDVGTSFAASDVALTGGSKGAFTRVSSTLYRLVAIPEPDAVGTLAVSVAAGAFSDVAGNPSAAPASARQAYDTRVTRTQMTLPVTFDVATQDYAVYGFDGAEDSSIVLDPGGSTTNHVVKVVRSATAQTWAGTTISKQEGTPPAPIGFASPIPFSATDTRVSVRVWSPDAGTTVRLKAEDHANSAKFVEVDATTVTSTAWETLTFDFGTAGLNLANTYDLLTIFFDFGVAGATAGEKTYYFDDVVFAGGGGLPVATVPTALPSVPPSPVTTTVSLYSSVTGGYNGTASDGRGRIDLWPCASWSSAVCDGPFAIDPAAATSAAPLKFVFTHLTGENVGLEFTGAHMIDAVALGLTSLHVDLWTPDNASNFQVKLVDFGANGAWEAPGTGDNTEGIATLTAGSTPHLATGAWLSYDLPLATAFTGGGGLQNFAHLAQLLFVAPNGGTMYIDNLYFH